FQSLIGILVDFNGVIFTPSPFCWRFQSLIGILVDFNRLRAGERSQLRFQSLIGILVDFNPSPFMPQIFG
ncbi:hypothetical protein, partial [Fischerella thermalis]|uniref:hypothetical protein n=1 Tax=Fischerella thermalis TaxID=372787 RepID=UPI001CA5AB87